MRPWDLKETYSAVKGIFGREQELLVRESTRSVFDRQAFVTFHYGEILRLSKNIDRSYVKENLFVVLHRDPRGKSRVAFEKFIIKAGAHATAAVHCLHAIPDIISHSIYFATGHNFSHNPEAEQKADLPFVVKELKRSSNTHRLGELLAEMRSGDSWQHLAALSNMSKHRSLVRTTFNEDWTGTRVRKRELQFMFFEKGGKRFPSIAVVDLLESESDRLSIQVIKVGNELDVFLRDYAG